MAEEPQKTAAEAAPPAEDVLVRADAPPAEKSSAEKEPLLASETETEAPAKPEAAVEKKIAESASFKEETNIASDLPGPHKKALDELKQLIQEALNKHEFTTPPPPPPAKEEEKPPAEAVKEEKPPAVEEESKTEEKEKKEVPVEIEPEVAAPPPLEEKAPATAEPSETVVIADDDGAKTVEAIEKTVVAVPAPPSEEAPPPPPPKVEQEEEAAETSAVPPATPEEVSIWGIPLLQDDRSDVILLKFLRARDFKVKDAFSMIKNTVAWRKAFGIDDLLDQELGTDLDKVVFMHGIDKEGHPVCYNVYGEFQNKELYQSTFSDEEKRKKFLSWRIQFLEKSIRKLDFSPSGISTIVQVNDMKNFPGAAKRELRQVTKQALHLLQDNYPEFVAKQVFVNVPWWYLAFNRMMSPFLTQRTKSKFVFAGPSKTADTLFKYIAPEQVPVQYGGLSKEGDQEFTTANPVIEVPIKPASRQVVEFPVSEGCHLIWETRVVGWEVSYGAEFVPSAEDGYTVIVQKSRKLFSADEPVICNSYKSGEPGKIVLTIDNQTSKKKKLLYRFKTKQASN